MFFQSARGRWAPKLRSASPEGLKATIDDFPALGSDKAKPKDTTIKEDKVVDAKTSTPVDQTTTLGKSKTEAPSEDSNKPVSYAKMLKKVRC